MLISAAIWPDSKPGIAFDRARREGEILLSLAVLSELSEVFDRKRLRRYIDAEDSGIFLDALSLDALWIGVDIEIHACRDPKDDKFLSLAMSGGATHIVTGDKDLLDLDPFYGIRILTPHAFLELP